MIMKEKIQRREKGRNEILKGQRLKKKEKEIKRIILKMACSYGKHNNIQKTKVGRNKRETSESCRGKRKGKRSKM